MFAGAASFNQALGDWRVDKVEDTSYMFWEASSFNQPLGAVSKHQRGSTDAVQHRIDGVGRLKLISTQAWRLEGR